MKKVFGLLLCLLLAVLCVSALADVSLDETNFPESVLREAVGAYDENNDGQLSADEISRITSLDLSRTGIASVKGIEHLTSLQFLYCVYNNLTEIDTSRNASLGVLVLHDNKLKKLDVSGNPNLYDLNCNSNQLTELDVTVCPALRELACGGNNLKTINVKKNPLLENLWCWGDQLTELDLDNNPKLKILNCRFNSIKSLDVSKCPLLCEMVKTSDPFLNEEGYYGWVFDGDGDGRKDRYFYLDQDVSVTIDGVLYNGEERQVVFKGGKYELNAKKTAAVFTGPEKKTVKTLKIQNKVTIGGKAYKVTGIKAAACRGLKKLKKVTIGKYVKSIGKDAFENCTALQSVSGGAAVETIGDEAFENCKSLASFTLGSKVRKIGEEAFDRCKKLALIVVKTTKLTAKNVGKNAFSGISAKAVCECPAKMKKAYSKLFLKKGAPAGTTFR